MYGRWGLWAMNNGRTIVLGCVLLTLLSLLLASRLRVDSDLLSLMPKKDPSIMALRALEEEEGGVNLVTIAVSGKPENTQPFLAALQAKLEASPRVDYALYDIDDELAWRLGLVTLKKDELESIRDRLKGALALGPGIANPFISARLLDLGPMTDKLSQADARAGLMATQGMERLVIRPNGRAQDLPFARELMAEIHGAMEELDPKAHGVHNTWISGAYRFNVEDYEGILYDVSTTGMASVAMLVLTMLLAFRDPRVLGYLMLPMLLATAWTFGLAGASIGTVNTFTSVLGALLTGLGIDYSVHLYTRYREERATAESLEEAIVRTWDHVGPPCMAAALTSAAGFSALMFAQFKGFRQMGLLLSVGLMLCLSASLTILPPLLKWRERIPKPWGRFRPGLRRPNRPPTYRFAPLALIGMVFVTLVSGVFIRRIQFEYDLSELRREGMAYADLTDLQKELTRASYAAIVASYPDDASLTAAHERISAQIASGELQHIERITSIRTIFPADQDERLAILREIAGFTRDPNYGYLPPGVRQNLDRLAATKLDAMGPDDLPRGLRHLLGANHGTHRILLFPSGNVWDLREVRLLRDEVVQAVPDVPVAGEYMALGSLADIVQKDAPRVALIALVLAFLGTLVDISRPKQALSVMGVLLAGMVWAGGALSLSHVKISIINFVGIPILLGIGVDVIIHLLHRIAEEGPGKVLKALTTTGWAAGISTATNVMGFASLVLATNEGIRSLGMLVLVGLTTLTVAAFLLVPIGWMTLWKIGGEAPADADRSMPPE